MSDCHAPRWATILALGTLLLSAVRWARAADATISPTTRPAASSFALVELFTSEGCSSCPPAEQVLAHALKEARAEKQPVFALAFHVDYWNRLGWRDRYSTAAFSARQQQYADAHHASGVYSPQMIVNGGDGFVGSDAVESKAQIRAALARRAGVVLTLAADKAADGRVRVHYTTQGAAAGAVLNVALAEREIVVKVGRGENAGKTLTHVNVVRTLVVQKVADQTDGAVEIDVPAGVNLSGCTLVGFLQDPASMSVQAAAGADIPS